MLIIKSRGLERQKEMKEIPSSHFKLL